MWARKTLIAFGCLLLAGQVFADDSQTPRDLQMPKGTHACATDARVVDQDVNGVAVRKGPSTDAAIITMLPALHMAPNGGGMDLFGADVKIVGTNGRGWFLIENAYYEPSDENGGPQRQVQTWGETGRVYAGRGWVHGSRLNTDIVLSRGMHKAAGNSAPIIHPIDRPAYGPEITSSFLDCAGRAVKLRATYEGKVIEGWIDPSLAGERLCASQRTTCN